MAARPVPPAPRLVHDETGETSLTLSWPTPPAGAGVQSLRLFVREFPKPWEQARVVELPLEPADAEAAARRLFVVGGLFPTSTFELRLAYVFAGGEVGEPGPAASGDTLAAGCTPKAEKERAGKGKGAGADKKKCAVA